MKKKELLRRLDACEGAADLKRLLSSDACEDATYGDAAMYREGALRLAEKAKSFSKPADIAAAIMWLVRLSSFEPHRILLDQPQLKEPVAKVLDAQRAFLREACTHKSAPVRVAAVHALACCRTSGSEELGFFTERLDREKNKTARATLALAIGALARHVEPPEGLRDRLVALLDHSDLLVQLCALCGAAYIDPAVPERASAIVARALDKPPKLPPQWGWFWLMRKCDGRDLAAVICGCVRFDDPAALFDSIAAARHTIPRNEALVDALMNTAFPSPPPASGIAVSELSDLQQRAIKSIAEVRDRYLNPGPKRWAEKLGIDEWKWEERFLEGKHVAWRPLEVSGGHRWHVFKIFNALAADELTRAAAADAITEGLTAAEAIEAALFASAYREADQRLAIAVFERLAQRGVDVVEVGGSVAENHQIDRYIIWVLGVLATCRLRSEPPPDDFDGALVEALGEVVTLAPFDELFATLPEQRRAALLLASHEEHDSDWSWPGMRMAHTAFGPEVARAVVQRVSDVPEQLELARNVVARTGSAGRKVLAGLRLNEVLEKTRDALLAAT